MTSTIPAAIIALEQVLVTALPGWTVVDGPVFDIPATSNFACVAFTGERGETAVTTVASPNNAAATSNHESYDIACVLTAHVGKVDFITLRSVAYAALGAIEAALEASRDLGGTVGFAQLSSHALIQDVGETGTAVTVPFTVHIDAWK